MILKNEYNHIEQENEQILGSIVKDYQMEESYIDIVGIAINLKEEK